MKRTDPAVRKRCRELYGDDWWNVDKETKQKRQDAALAALAPSTEDATADERALVELAQRALPGASVVVRRLDVPPAVRACYDAVRATLGAPTERRWLFHGTTADAAASIVRNGFNRSYCGKNATAFGKGVYFARDMAYSVQDRYSPPDDARVKTVLAARVAVGAWQVGRADQVEPDTTSEGRRYDTTTNSTDNPSIFVVYRDYQALPEYELRLTPP